MGYPHFYMTDTLANLRQSQVLSILDNSPCSFDFIK